MRLGATRAKEKKKKKKKFVERLACVFHGVFHRRLPRSLPGKNNENIDPRENDDTLSRRFPGPGDLHRLHSRRRRRRQATRVFRREQARAAFNARFFGCFLSKQTSRRYAGRSFSIACKHVSALSTPAWPYYGRRREWYPRFSASWLSTNIPLVLGTCVNKSRIVSTFFDVHALRKRARSNSDLPGGGTRWRGFIREGFDERDELHVKQIWQASKWKCINYEFCIFLQRDNLRIVKGRWKCC